MVVVVIVVSIVIVIIVKCVAVLVVIVHSPIHSQSLAVDLSLLWPLRQGKTRQGKSSKSKERHGTQREGVANRNSKLHVLRNFALTPNHFETHEFITHLLVYFSLIKSDRVCLVRVCMRSNNS